MRFVRLFTALIKMLNAVIMNVRATACRLGRECVAGYTERKTVKEMYDVKNNFTGYLVLIYKRSLIASLTIVCRLNR